MWPRFVGSTTKRKLTPLQFEECTDEPPTSAPKRKSLDLSSSLGSARRRITPVVVEDRPASSCISRGLFPKVWASSERTTKCSSSSTPKGQRPVTERPQKTTPLSSKPFPSIIRANSESARRVPVTPKTSRRHSAHASRRSLMVEETQKVVKRETPRRAREDEEEMVVIECSPNASPIKQLPSEVDLLSEADSVSDVPPRPCRPPTVQNNSSASSTTSRRSYFEPNRIVSSPSPPKRQRKKKLRGLAAVVANHLKSCRMERYTREGHPDNGTMRVELEGTVRCQCSTQKGAVPCYNNWCEVNNGHGKEGACALVQTGMQRHFACVRVSRDSGDECKVDRINGQLQVRCWCRSSDYCNVDLADRVEEEQEGADGDAVSAEEIVTSPTTRLRPTTAKDDFVIDNAYDTDDDRLTGVNYDDGDFSLEDSFPAERHRGPPESIPPPLPPTRQPTTDGPTIPPWRREIPSSGGSPPQLPPPRAPERPDRLPPPRPVQSKVADRWPERVDETTTEPPRSDRTRLDWEEWERARQEYERSILSQWTRTPTSPSPSARSTTSTTTTTTPSTTTTTTTRRPTTTTTTSTSTTTTTPRQTTTENIADALIRLMKNREEAKLSYSKHKQRYRPYDLSAPESTASTTTTSASTSASAILFGGSFSTATTKRPITTTTDPPTTRRRTTTTTTLPTTRRTTTEAETGEETVPSLEQTTMIAPGNVNRSSPERDTRKSSSAAGVILALLVVFVF